MKIGILGTGMVGQTIGAKLVELGFEVRLGARQADNENARTWVAASGKKASAGTFADAAAFGELIFHCVTGQASIDVLKAAGAENLAGKVLIDITNPLDFSKGMPPTLFSGNDDSLGEQAQRLLPKTHVVKALNTINCQVMVDAGRIPGEHDSFVSGNDAQAKAKVISFLREHFGWKSVIDLGDISTARGTESYLPLWLRLWGALKTPDFNIRIVKKA